MATLDTIRWIKCHNWIMQDEIVIRAYTYTNSAAQISLFIHSLIKTFAARLHNYKKLQNIIMRNMGKRPLYYTWKAKIQIRMPIRVFWSGHSLFDKIYYNIHWFCKRATQALISLRKCAGWSGPPLPANCSRALFVFSASNAFSNLCCSLDDRIFYFFCNKLSMEFYLRRHSSSWPRLYTVEQTQHHILLSFSIAVKLQTPMACLSLLILVFESLGYFTDSSRKHMLCDILEVVLSGESFVYLTSSGHPTDIGLQLGKACYPCSR